MPYKDKEKEKECRKRNYHKWKQYMADYQKENKEQTDLNKKVHHLKKYNLNAAEYLQMMVKQNNLCAICHEPQSIRNKNGDIRPLYVDHCHTTGKVRGLLCNHCNSVLGHARDRTFVLENAIAYLETSK